MKRVSLALTILLGLATALYVAKHARGKWIIEGAGYAGGVFHIEIGQRDAKILELWHEV